MVLFARTEKERDLWVKVIGRTIDIKEGARPPYEKSKTYDLAKSRH